MHVLRILTRTHRWTVRVAFPDPARNWSSIDIAPSTYWSKDRNESIYIADVHAAEIPRNISLPHLSRTASCLQLCSCGAAVCLWNRLQRVSCIERHLTGRTEGRTDAAPLLLLLLLSQGQRDFWLSEDHPHAKIRLMAECMDCDDVIHRRPSSHG